jgi:O-antigen/teichoic acid export membrane protein
LRAPASALTARVSKQFRDPTAMLLGTQLISMALRLGSNLVLAHLLIPRDFGLVGITTLVATALALLAETGAWLGIVRQGSNLTREWLDQMWTLQAMRGVLLWLIALAIAPIVSKAYGEPELRLLLPVANLWLVILSLESLYPFVRYKDLKPGLGLLLQLLTQVVGAIISIIGALIYPSPWALVGGLLAGAAAATIMGHVWSGAPLPRPHMTRAFLRQQWKLASLLIVSTALSFLGSQIDRLLFPGWFGTDAFGVYSVALTLGLVPLTLGQRWADSLYLPAVAKLSEAESPSAEHQLRSLGRIVVIYAAVASGLVAGVGMPFFEALYPRRFAPAATFIEVLAVTVYATFITYLHRRTLLAQGMTHVEAAVEGSRLVLFLAGLGVAMLFFRRPSAVEYVALYAAVQVVVYVGLMVIGRVKRLVHFRDDFSGHAVFLAVIVGLTLLGNAVERQFGSLGALLVCGLVGGTVCLAAAVCLGLPKLPMEPLQPVDPEFVDPLGNPPEL